VLLVVGYKLANPKTILHFWRKGLYQFIPFAATLVAVVALDLLEGVGIGLAISIFFVLQGNRSAPTTSAVRSWRRPTKLRWIWRKRCRS